MSRAYDSACDVHFGDVVQIMVSVLIRSSPIRRSEMVKELIRRKYDLGVILDAEESLEKMGMIKVVRIPIGDDALITLIEGE